MVVALLLLLLGLFSRSSAQLFFLKTESVVKTVCNHTFLLPCYVTNLKVHSKTAMFVEWKFNGQTIYSFDGNGSILRRRPEFSSGTINRNEVEKGDVSLSLGNMDQAVEGTYTCVVTEQSSKGFNQVSVIYREVYMFHLREYLPIALGLSLTLIFFWVHFAVSAIVISSSDKPTGKIFSIAAVFGIFCTILVMVGLELIFTHEYSLTSQFGLGIAVIPTTFTILLLQFYLHPVSGRNNVIIMLITGLKGIEYVIIVVGCSVCLSACPAPRVPLLIAGIVVFALLVLADLVYSLSRYKWDTFQGLGEMSTHGDSEDE